MVCVRVLQMDDSCGSSSTHLSVCVCVCGGVPRGSLVQEFAPAPAALESPCQRKTKTDLKFQTFGKGGGGQHTRQGE